MPHGGSTPLTSLVVSRLGLVGTLLKDLGIVVGSILGSFRTAALECKSVTLVLQTLGSHQALNLGGLGVWLLALGLGLDLTANDELTDIILLAEAEEAANLGGPLGTQALWLNGVGDSWNVVVSNLDDAKGKNREIHADDAATNTLPLALTSTTRSVAGVALGKKK